MIALNLHAEGKGRSNVQIDNKEGNLLRNDGI